jgi:hypothetical protein
MARRRSGQGSTRVSRSEAPEGQRHLRRLVAGNDGVFGQNRIVWLDGNLGDGPGSVVALLGSLRSALPGRGDLVLENLALRQQLALLRHRSKRPQFRLFDRAVRGAGPPPAPGRSLQRDKPTNLDLDGPADPRGVPGGFRSAVPPSRSRCSLRRHEGMGIAEVLAAARSRHGRTRTPSACSVPSDAISPTT